MTKQNDQNNELPDWFLEEYAKQPESTEEELAQYDYLKPAFMEALDRAFGKIKEEGINQKKPSAYTSDALEESERIAEIRKKYPNFIPLPKIIPSPQFIYEKGEITPIPGTESDNPTVIDDILGYHGTTIPRAQEYMQTGVLQSIGVEPEEFTFAKVEEEGAIRNAIADSEMHARTAYLRKMMPFGELDDIQGLGVNDGYQERTPELQKLCEEHGVLERHTKFWVEFADTTHVPVIIPILNKALEKYQIKDDGGIYHLIAPNGIEKEYLGEVMLINEQRREK
tara:strand:+ start:226 stop:1071 length:846 start_codon:yes stop_codon:yes gene_type:complete